MHKPSEYLPRAVAGLRSRLMPDCSMVLCHAGRCATVTRVGSPSRGEDALTETEIGEDVRVLALSADYPTLTKGSLVELGGRWRIVTSARTDPAGATLSLGMSAELEKCRVAYRRPGTKIAVRRERRAGAERRRARADGEPQVVRGRPRRGMVRADRPAGGRRDRDGRREPARGGRREAGRVLHADGQGEEVTPCPSPLHSSARCPTAESPIS